MLHMGLRHEEVRPVQRLLSGAGVAGLESYGGERGLRPASDWSWLYPIGCLQAVGYRPL
jgi:hypothetical protein